MAFGLHGRAAGLVWPRLLIGNVVLAGIGVAAQPAAAQFSAREGFTQEGAYHWSFEVAPYLFLPAVDANVGLNHPPGTDVSINQPRPTVSQLITKLTGAFVGYGLVRYGDFSAELNIDYVATEETKTLRSLRPGFPGASLKATNSFVFVSPGFGYRVLPTDAASKFALDARVGFSYNEVSASAGFAESRLGGVSYSSSFVQPWIGARASYFPSPNWRLGLDVAATGLGVDGGVIGWNARAGVSYLIAKWVDVTTGYAALETERRLAHGINGEDRSVSILAYGPVLAFGFRF